MRLSGARAACKRRSFTIVVASAVAVSLGLGVGVEGSRATYPGTTDGRIAFGNDVVDAPGRPPDIYSVMPNGKALHRLTDDPAADICPAYSADGKEIAFCSDRTGAFEIWKMKQNGTQQVQVTRGAQAIFPDFSPDASKIAFMSLLPPPFAYEIYTIDSEGTGSPLRLTNSPGLDGFPVYSPDGSKIAFLSARTGLAQVWVMDADGSNPVQLTFDAARKDQLPDWSPDGSKIAYESDATGNGDIYVMNADGSGQTQLTNTPQREFGTAWSPDGSQIAFVRVLGTAQTDRAIYVMNADGSNQHMLTQGTRVPAWQPRGRRPHD